MGNHETMMRLALDPATPRTRRDRRAANLDANGGDGRSRNSSTPSGRPSDLAELLETARAALPAGAHRALARSPCSRTARSGDVLFVHAGVNPRCRRSKPFSPRPGTRRSRGSTRTATGPGCAGPFSTISPARRAWAAISSSTATRRTTRRATPRTPIRSPLPPQSRRAARR